MKTICNVFLVALGCLLLLGCEKEEQLQKHDLNGVWILMRLTNPFDTTVDYPFNNGGATKYRIYEGDSVFYECDVKPLSSSEWQNIATASDVVVVPTGKLSFAKIYKGGGEFLYLEDNNPRPLRFASDTSVVIQKFGVKYTWVRARDMDEERVEEIKSIIAGNATADGHAPYWYVLSTKERKLETANNTLAYIVVILLLVVAFTVYVAISIRQKKKSVERQLQQINDEREHRPLPVQQAMEEVEARFFSSDYYLSLRRRIAAGEMLRQQDRQEIEQQLKPVCPGFANQLLGLCRMSELEYHVCLLIRLQVSPSEMATVLSKDASTISTVRSRLYQKVFKRKGSSKDWDDFVRSL